MATADSVGVTSAGTTAGSAGVIFSGATAGSAGVTFSGTTAGSTGSSDDKDGRGGTVGALANSSSTSETESSIKSSTDGSFTNSSVFERLLKSEKSSSLPLSVALTSSSLFNLSKSRKICSLKLNFSSSREFSLKGITSLLIIHNIIS